MSYDDIEEYDHPDKIEADARALEEIERSARGQFRNPNNIYGQWPDEGSR